MVKVFDIVIIGGGAVGLSLALRLGRESSYQVLVVEARDLESVGSTVDRSMALSLSSQKFYSALKLWPKLLSQASAIEKVHVSMQHHYGTTRIDASQYQVPALGYVLPLSHIENTLIDEIAACKNISLWSNTRLLSINSENSEEKKSKLLLTRSQSNEQIEIFSTLLIGTDGASSQVAKNANIQYQKTEYGHVAIICHVELSIDHDGVAYERFTQDGALAFLPFGKNRATFVWTVSESRALILLAMTETAYLQAALDAFGYRLGRFRGCSLRITYPLVQSIAMSQWQGQIVLIGNSAHTLHPIAAQGLNLSLKDVDVFLNVIKKGLSDPMLGQYYLEGIASHQKKVIWLTNQIAKQVSSSRFPGWLKACLMVGLDGFSPIKHPFSKLTMGLSA